MTFYCKYCGSENVAHDAMVHANTGEVITTYDNGYCLDCEKDNSWFEFTEEKMETMNEVQQITVSKEDWDNLVAHRDNLESIVKVNNDKILSMQRIIDQQAVAAADDLEVRFKSLKDNLGISSLEDRIYALEAKINDDAPLTKQWVKEAIKDALENFDVEEALSSRQVRGHALLYGFETWR